MKLVEAPTKVRFSLRNSFVIAFLFLTVTSVVTAQERRMVSAMFSPRRMKGGGQMMMEPSSSFSDT